MRQALLRLLPLAVLAGCATTEIPPGPSLPGDMATPAGQARKIPWSELPENELRTRIARLIPGNVKDRNGWAGDLYTAYSRLNIPAAPQTYCATIAVIEQESSFQADPVVPGLPDIVWRGLEERVGKFGMPKFMLRTAMLKTSPDGKSYTDRINALKTEKQLNALYGDMIAELPFGKSWLSDYNPVRTAGPMQVSVAFAEEHAREKTYPYPPGKSIRDEVFTRRGGVYFGAAILLDYPAPYDDVLFRFADFNAGRYSSRNAAFQAALNRLAGTSLSLDGDLLRYEKGRASAQSSGVETALARFAGRLQMSRAEIRRDLLLEKSAAFSDSPLFNRLFRLAEVSAGRLLPRQQMPQIDLKSPKITRQLTTEWFARRVENRYRTCLGRAETS